MDISLVPAAPPPRLRSLQPEQEGARSRSESHEKMRLASAPGATAVAFPGAAVSSRLAGSANLPPPEAEVQGLHAAAAASSSKNAYAAQETPRVAGVEMDETVLAYAQWLSEMKVLQQGARTQQQQAMEMMRDAVHICSRDVVDIKRVQNELVQQLQQMQAQFGDLSARLQEVGADVVQQRAQGEEAQKKLRIDMEAARRAFVEHVDRLHLDVNCLSSSLQGLEADVGGLKTSLGGGELGAGGFGGRVQQFESDVVDMRDVISSMKQEFADTRQDWKKGQDLLGQAITTLSQDFADSQKHVSTITQNLQTDAYRIEEVCREVREVQTRTDTQIANVQQTCLKHSNDLVTLHSQLVGLKQTTRDLSASQLTSRSSSQVRRSESAAVLESSVSHASTPEVVRSSSTLNIRSRMAPREGGLSPDNVERVGLALADEGHSGSRVALSRSASHTLPVGGTHAVASFVSVAHHSAAAPRGGMYHLPNGQPTAPDAPVVGMTQRGFSTPGTPQTPAPLPHGLGSQPWSLPATFATTSAALSTQQAGAPVVTNWQMPHLGQ
eukprot:TRINITY_DN43429_c1_g1_i4.p1 TRINITY_DN43429_c1_g1~~TRINITY_DN43429_c1_g1_i4.p1  ORF type:complete len:553 (+),score=156.37 TRINITY_DN43429_c1_g1_i4:123-1781(+)